MGTTDSVLHNAKAALDKANKFTSSVTGGKPSAFAPKASPSYAAARAARSTPTSSIQSEAESAASGLKAKQQNVDEYSKSPQ